MRIDRRLKRFAIHHSAVNKENELAFTRRVSWSRDKAIQLPRWLWESIPYVAAWQIPFSFDFKQVFLDFGAEKFSNNYFLVAVAACAKIRIWRVLPSESECNLQ